MNTLGILAPLQNPFSNVTRSCRPLIAAMLLEISFQPSSIELQEILLIALIDKTRTKNIAQKHGWNILLKKRDERTAMQGGSLVRVFMN